MEVVKEIFRNIVTNLFCTWYNQKNILAKVKKWFETNEDFKAFMHCWKDVAYVDMEEKLQIL